MPRPTITRRILWTTTSALVFALLLAASGCNYWRTIAAEDYLKNGSEALENGRPRAARQAFRKALREDPSPHVQARIGLAYYAAHMCRDAITHLDKARARAPRQPFTVRLALILCLQRTGKPRQAEDVLAEALRIHYHDAMALNDLGYTVADRGLYLQTALRLLERAVELAPDDAAIVDSLGWAHYRLGHLREARGLLQRAVRLDPGQPELLYHLGVVCRDMGDVRAAAGCFSRALKNDPRYRPAFEELTRLGPP